MNLYMQALSSSTACHVACLEAGIPITLHWVARKNYRLDDGRSFRDISAKGMVPALMLPDGELLTESAAILQYIADQAPATGLAPAFGTPERYRLIEWLSFTSSELHKKHLWMMFSPSTQAEIKIWARGGIGAVLGHVDRHLQGRDYLVGDRFTVADAYMLWCAMAAGAGGVDLKPYAALRAHSERVQGRPSVLKALQVEMPLYQRDVEAGAAPAPLSALL